MKKKKKKELKENKQTKGEARGESTQVSLFWFALWVNYKIFYVAIHELIPFSCMLKKFFQYEDIVLPAAFLFHCGRGMSLRVQMIQDLSTIKTLCATLPHQTTAPSKLNPKIPQRRNGNKTGFGCSFPLVTSSDRRNRWCNGLRTRRL